MFGIGTSELLIILFIVLLLFGASRLPELGRGLGQGMRSFKDAFSNKPEAKSDAQDSEPKKS